MTSGVHALAAVAAASFLPSVVRASQSGDASVWLAAALGGLLPNALEWLDRALAHTDALYTPDPALPSDEIADEAARMVARFAAMPLETGRAVRLRVRPLPTSAGRLVLRFLGRHCSARVVVAPAPPRTPRTPRENETTEPAAPETSRTPRTSRENKTTEYTEPAAPETSRTPRTSRENETTKYTGPAAPETSRTSRVPEVRPIWPAEVVVSPPDGALLEFRPDSGDSSSVRLRVRSACSGRGLAHSAVVLVAAFVALLAFGNSACAALGTGLFAHGVLDAVDLQGIPVFRRNGRRVALRLIDGEAPTTRWVVSIVAGLVLAAGLVLHTAYLGHGRRLVAAALAAGAIVLPWHRASK